LDFGLGCADFAGWLAFSADPQCHNPKMTSTWRHWALVAVTLAASVTVIASSYTVLNDTIDESNHISAGLEWLERGSYTFEPKHPPVGRIMVALGPYASGLRLPDPFNIWLDYRKLLQTEDYWRVLTSARIGALPFLAAGGIAVFLWGRAWFDAATGVIACMMFLALPAVLGHAGMATLDIPCLSTLLWSFFCLLRLREQPSRKWIVASAIACTIAILTKMSNLFFLGAGVLVLGPYWLSAVWDVWKSDAVSRRKLLVGVAQFLVLAFICAWGIYRFHLSSVSDQIALLNPSGKALVNAKLHALRSPVRSLVEIGIQIPFPLLELARGIQQLFEHNRLGHASVLFGEHSTKGFWYFFPVMIVLKTPLPFLISLLMGVWFFAADWPKLSWPQRATFLLPVAILGLCMASLFSIGLRHCIAIFPFLSLLTAYGLIRVGRLIAQRSKLAGWGLPVLFIFASWATCVSAAPDNLSYFNSLAGSDPARITADSNIDWGQDLARLGKRLKERKIETIQLEYFGAAAIERHIQCSVKPVDPNAKTSGWVAISAHRLHLAYAKDGSYGWLRQYKPLEIVGKSIYLYYID
jgi:hypothetical protein